ncbi:hypothetical protein ACO22_08115 [Paracoccidioides brasiliensis]|uniref:Uncharacterized protein n=1 Tax=Paracoccidioides brasiliensis TaxID=121759 RepID=A0A1D2J2S4_PARBR|nr:hypothetical protein ACO22_08115 [Paracoccidioides brasiliensis]
MGCKLPSRWLRGQPIGYGPRVAVDAAAIPFAATVKDFTGTLPEGTADGEQA